MTEPIVVDIDIASLHTPRVKSAVTLSDTDMLAANTLDNQTRVSPQSNDSVVLADGVATISLPPVS